MRKLNLDAALEAMEAMSVASEDDVAAFVAAAESLDKEAVIAELASSAQAEIKSSIEAIGDCFATLDRLVNMSMIIREYGISEPMMRMADPAGELVAAGVCGAYESLGLIPEKGAVSDLALEGLADIIKTVTKKLSSLLTTIMNKIKDFGTGWKKLLGNYGKDIAKAQTILRGISINEEAFAKSSVNALSKDAFDSIMISLTKLFGAIDMAKLKAIMDEVATITAVGSMPLEDMLKVVVKISKFFDGSDLIGDRSMASSIGLMLEVTSKKTFMVADGRRLSSTRREAGNLGWTGADLIPAVDSVQTLLIYEDQLDKSADLMVNIIERIMKMNTSYSNEVDQNGESFTEEVRSYDVMTLAAINLIDTIFSMLLKSSKSVVEASATVVLLTAAASKAS